MKGEGKKLIKYMDDSDTRFVIPVYQRNYDWRIEHCRRLYDDLVKVIKDKRESHFFGSIVSVFNPDGARQEFLIIDGQQRLTTVSLLFLAMYNLMDSDCIIPEKANLKQRIYEGYLVDKFQPEELRIKLKPIKDDQVAFEKLFGDPSEYVRESNLTENYKYFYDRIQKREITIDQLYEAICKLEIIDITLNGEDNPQLIFESLNSTGLDLSEGDKIRNFILMGLPSKEQEKYYQQYWNKIEKYTNYDVSAFVRDYLSVKQQSIPSQKKIYTNFREYVESHNIETESLLKDLLDYAKRYGILVNGQTNNAAIDACIERLNRLETTVTRPFFLEILRLFEEEKWSVNQVTDIFLITENYLFRRSICDLPTNALNKIFLMLHKEIMRYDGTSANYLEKFKYAILSKKERGRFPNDEEFIKAFSEKQVYLMNSKNKIYILERLENHGTIEDKDVYRHFDQGDYSIEHIMPQHLTPAWQRELGADYEQIHEEWLHRIANLTITAYNSKYSNNSFEEKKTMKNGFQDSGIRMNTYIAQKDKWTLQELMERDLYLQGQALEIWPEPVTEYEPEEKELDSYTLEDDADMTGRLITRFAFKNTEQPVDSWIDMFQKVLQILCDEDRTIITRLAVSQDNGIALHFSMDPNAFQHYMVIGDDIYVWSNTNTQSKLSILSKLFELYDESPNDLVFYLKDENNEDRDEEGSRFEIRRRYWTFALPFIKEANDENGAFSNVNPSKENWISGFFGISGFNISCVANFDSARIDLFLGKSDSSVNKKVYNELLAHKNEIEKTLNVSLDWDGGEDKKSCKISYALETVSIGNETDWEQMARFHAEWSNKFYKAFVPYIEMAI